MQHILQDINNIRHSKKIIFSIASFILILILIPLLIEWGTVYALKQQGAKSASINNVDVNLFDGTFKLEELKAQFDDKEPLRVKLISANLSIISLLGNKIVVDGLIIDGINLRVHKAEDGVISINGFTPPDSNETVEEKNQDDTDSPVKFAIMDLQFSNSTVDYQETGFKQKLNIQSITLRDLVSWKPGSKAELNFQLSEQKTHINGHLNLQLFSQTRGFKGDIAIKQLDPSTYQKFYKDHLNQLAASIDFSAELDLTMNDSLSGHVKHSLNIGQLALNYQQLEQKVEKITWSGNANLVNNDTAVSGNLSIKNSRTSDLENNTLLSQFDALDINALNYAQQKITFDQLNINNIDLLQDAKNITLVSLESIVLQQLDFDLENSALNLEKVELKTPDINATLSEQKQLTHLALIDPVLTRLSPKTDDTKQAEEPPAKAMQINVENITLLKPGLLKFSDLSVQPNYNTNLHFEKIDVHGLSSEHEATFTLLLKQGEYTIFDINGSGLMFTPKQKLNLTTNITQLDLPPVSSYTGKTTGYGIKSGVVDSTIEVTIKDEKIDSHITLKIDSIDVTEIDKESAQQLSSASGMSIDMALNTLKDKNNIIDLEMPINGDVNDPNFDLSLIINKALGDAMKSATFSYLKYALQPFGSLLTLFNIAKDAANHISLAPVAFADNSHKIPDDQIALLDKVNNILDERPGIKIKACGISSLADQKLITQQLIDIEKEKILAKKTVKELKDKVIGKIIDTLVSAIIISDDVVHQKMKDLADKRSANVKAYFIKQKGVKPARILNCLSNENLEDDSKSAVELVI